jgi:hypothetical protein
MPEGLKMRRSAVKRQVEFNGAKVFLLRFLLVIVFAGQLNASLCMLYKTQHNFILVRRIIYVIKKMCGLGDTP